MTFSNLRLGVRLGLSFTALIAAMLAIGAIGFRDMDALGSDTQDLADNDVRALTVAAALADRASDTAHLVAQHLYVNDGDVAAQDKLAARIAPVTGRNDVDIRTLRGLVGEGSKDELNQFDATEAKFAAAYDKAIKLSRSESVAHDVNRTASHNLYEKEVLPLSAQIENDAHALTKAVNTDALDHAHAGVQSADDGKRDIALVLLGAIIFAAFLAYVVTRSVTRPVAEIAGRLKSLNERCLAGLSRVLEAIAGGDLTQTTVSHTEPIDVKTRDELGQLSQTFNEMLDKAKGSIDSYNAMRAQLADVIGDVSSGAGTISAASQEMASTSEEAGKAIAEIAHAVGSVASGAEQQVREVDDAKRVTDELAEASRISAETADETAAAAEEARGLALTACRPPRRPPPQCRRTSSAQTSEAIRSLARSPIRSAGSSRRSPGSPRRPICWR